jgi:hypothetical protein
MIFIHSGLDLQVPQAIFTFTTLFYVRCDYYGLQQIMQKQPNNHKIKQYNRFSKKSRTETKMPIVTNTKLCYDYLPETDTLIWN